jgi:hypothetical protein
MKKGLIPWISKKIYLVLVAGGVARSQCASWLPFVELNKKVTDRLRERSFKLVHRASTPMDCVCCVPPKRD